MPLLVSRTEDISKLTHLDSVNQFKLKIDGLELILLSFIINLRIRLVKEQKTLLDEVELNKVIQDLVVNELNQSGNYLTVEGVLEHATTLQQDFNYFR